MKTVAKKSLSTKHTTAAKSLHNIRTLADLGIGMTPSRAWALHHVGHEARHVTNAMLEAATEPRDGNKPKARLLFTSFDLEVWLVLEDIGEEGHGACLGDVYAKTTIAEVDSKGKAWVRPSVRWIAEVDGCRRDLIDLIAEDWSEHGRYGHPTKGAA